MPIYEYECGKCGHVTEALRAMAEADKPLACEDCGGAGTKRRQSEFAAGVSKGDAGAAVPGNPGVGGCGRCGDPNGMCGF